VSSTYQAHEFAKRAGVTVRALTTTTGWGAEALRPYGRGISLYTDRDFVRLEQIVALKFIASLYPKSGS